MKISIVLANARQAAMGLSPEDRFVLAHELFESLDQNEDPISLEEIDRRLSDMRSGVAETLTLEEVEKSMQEALDGTAPAHP